MPKQWLLGEWYPRELDIDAVIVIKTQISNIVRTTRFWNKLNNKTVLIIW
jgi:hypothetical protein